MAAIVGGSFFVNKDISGAWLLVVNPELPVATADEIPESERVYYIFEKPDRYGKGNCNLCYQGAMEKLTFQLFEENKTQKINLGDPKLRLSVPACGLNAKNSPPDYFLNGTHLLNGQVLIKYKKIKGTKRYPLFLVRITGLEPA